ncbi:MAG: AraC family transcriptional regulator ligand-binding domain-containing protein [Myxococcaceae bacterium]
MSKHELAFDSRLAPLLLAFAKSKGLDPAPLVAQFALPAEVLQQPAPGKTPLETPVTTLTALADEVARALDDPHLGLSLSEWMPKGIYGVAEFLVRAGPTLRHSFENFVRFNAIVVPYQKFRFEEAGDEASFQHVTTLKPGVLGRHLQEYSSAVMIKALITLAPQAVLTRAWFSHARPADADLERLRRGLHTAELSFDEPTNGFTLERRWLETPVVGGDPALSAFLEEHAVAALASRPREDDFVDQLRHALRDALKHGEPNVERLATRLHLSGRTLQRRLAELGTSFQEVLDHVRFDLARQYLKDVRLDVSQVAYLLGYSELRAFDRAFRRWAEKTPTEWRASR